MLCPRWSQLAADPGRKRYYNESGPWYLGSETAVLRAREPPGGVSSLIKQNKQSLAGSSEHVPERADVLIVCTTAEAKRAGAAPTQVGRDDEQL